MRREINKKRQMPGKKIVCYHQINKVMMTLLIYSPVLPLSSKCGLNQGVPNGLDKKIWKKNRMLNIEQTQI